MLALNFSLDSTKYWIKHFGFKRIIYYYSNFNIHLFHSLFSKELQYISCLI